MMEDYQQSYQRSFLVTIGLVLLIAAMNLAFTSKARPNKENPKVALGRRLFYDQRLSINGARSCASCHAPELAFTDGYRKSLSIDGLNVARNSPSLINAKYLSSLTWADTTIRSFVMQMDGPMFSEHPKEMGWKGNEASILDRLNQDPVYQQMLKQVFPNKKEYTTELVKNAIAAFEETLVSFNAPYDRYLRGQTNALSPSARRGANLFFSGRTKCGVCHEGKLLGGENFDNVGLYNVGDTNSYPTADRGLFNKTGNPEDDGSFRIPSLRNVLLTAPYMHDGSVATIEEVIDIYVAGGRNIASGPYAGDGRKNVRKDMRVKPFNLSVEERKDLIAFLASLTDSSVLNNPRWKNPFQ
jgi:cytochrome c peroxidase